MQRLDPKRREFENRNNVIILKHINTENKVNRKENLKCLLWPPDDMIFDKQRPHSVAAATHLLTKC